MGARYNDVLLGALPLVVFGLAASTAGPAMAGCAPVPGPGDNTIVCNAATPPDPTVAPVNLGTGNDLVTVDSGGYPGGIIGDAGTKTLTLNGGTIGLYADAAGVTNMTFSVGGTATITGNVVMGDLGNTLTMRSGGIGGSVTQGNGVDSIVISAGTIGGAVSQGAGIDDFRMTGGQIQSLAQGDGRDTFFMSGGRIVGAFEDGDVAEMTGGRIGRVDMKLDNNIFQMSGGVIDGNLVTGFGNDAITVSGGSIGGNISVSGGTDTVIVTGGSIAGDVRMSTGNDQFTWAGGGTIAGIIDMGPDDDVAILRDLTNANLGATQRIDGGTGVDSLILGGSGQSQLNASIVIGFENLTKTDPGTWTLSGSLTDVQVATVQQGTLVLTGNNAGYTGQMIVDPAGTLEGRAQSLTPTITDNGLVRFAQPDTGTYAGVISGTGAVEKTGFGTTILTGTNTYSGGTTISSGTLQIGNGGTTGTIVGNVTDNGTLAFNRSDTVTFAGLVSGTGSLTQAGAGTSILTANNTYTGGTTIAAGTLQLGNGGTSGAIVGNVADNGALVFNRSDTVTFAGLVSGTGTVTQAGTGTTILTANNTYTGGTTIASGGLQLGNGGASGAIVGNVSNGGLLAFDRSDVVTFLGVISGSGAVAQIGAGTTVLTAASSYSGGTSVTAGTLALAASAALTGGGETTVAAGGTLGGYGRVVGTVSNVGTIAVADALPVFSGGVKGALTIDGTLVNAGLIQVGGAGTGNSIVATNYLGQNGRIGLNTVLGSDGSPSDTVVINGGVASGRSSLAINPVGGGGGLTVADGILVVNAVNGGSTAAGAFTLAGPVSAGAYEYLLFRGGVSPGTADNWYLRNTTTAPINPVPPPVGPAAPETPAAAPAGPPLPLYRPEVALYTAVPVMAREMGVTMVGTFHERQGNQSLPNGNGAVPGAWARVVGQQTDQRFGGPVAPEFNGTIWGLQAGLDLYGIERPDGNRDRFGIFYGYARSNGDVRGFASGVLRSPVGQLGIDGNSLGAYWTHIGPTGWYVDAVVMNTWLDTDSLSTGGVGANVSGSLFTASLEGGYPIALGGGLILEPQAQVIAQHLSLDRTFDRFSSIGFDTGGGTTARLGLRLEGRYRWDTVEITPYLKVNLWRDFGTRDKVVFAGTDIVPVSDGERALEVAGGVSAKLNGAVSAFATAGYTTGIGGSHLRTLRGNVGVKVVW